MNSAHWMIQAIEQRRQTMLKVMNFIVDRQREFFEKGVEYLKPLTLREVADVINMHESTASRVTNEKYVQTPRSEEHTSELQSPCNLVCRLLLEKKKLLELTVSPF